MPSRSSQVHEALRDQPNSFPTADDTHIADRVTRESPTSRPSGEDVVTSYQPVMEAPTVDGAVRQPAVVLPEARLMLSLAAPGLVTTASIALAFAIVTMTGANSAWFIAPVVLPGLLLGALRPTGAGGRWRESAGINLATMLILFPLLIIRQSTVRVPYLDMAHGTVFAALLSTSAVLMALVGLAGATAWISRESPEASALLFMPAALLVPLLTSATEFAELESALLVAGSIFLVATVLLLIASVVPAAYVVFVAPLAVALEVLFVTMVRQDRIFPVGVNEAGMALFAAVVVAAIALVVMLPSLSTWLNTIDQIRAANDHRRAQV